MLVLLSKTVVLMLVFKDNLRSCIKTKFITVLMICLITMNVVNFEKYKKTLKQYLDRSNFSTSQPSGFIG